MKRIIIAVLCLYALSLSALAQQPKPTAEVTDKQWRNLLVAVSNENWDMAVNLSSKYLKQLKERDERLPRLRYIYVYAAAGKVSEGEMSFDELEQSVKDVIGKEVVLPYRPITQNCRGALNFICSSEGAKDKLFVTATNKTGTTIHSFEYVQLKENFDVASHEGEEASIGGIIEAIKPNPNRSRAIVMRVYITKGVIKIKGQEPQKTSMK